MYVTRPKFIKQVDVSFLIPTNRYAVDPDMIKTCVQSIKDQSVGLTIEILMFSQDEIDIEGVTWVKEEGRQGPVFGFNHLARLAKGDYLAPFTDDMMYTSHIQNSIDFLNNSDFEYGVCGLSVGGSCKIPTNNPRYSHNTMIRFIFMNRECFKKLENYIFHPDLFYHGGDIWLSYFLATKGSPAVEGGSTITTIKPCKDSSFERGDCDKVGEFMTNFPDPKRYIV